LDGCKHVYLDMGTNTGVQIRKLFEPHLFPNASVLAVFDKFFGHIGERDLTNVCAVGFEPNVLHNEVLGRLQDHYQACGWRVYINKETGIGKEEKENVEFAHKKVWTETGLGENVAYTDPLGKSGRMENEKYAKDSAIKMIPSKVRQIRIAEFINKIVATRRLELESTSQDQFPPSVVMKLDVEGRELDVLPDLVMSGALQHLDHLHVDYTRDGWTDLFLVENLSIAMRVLVKLAKDRGLIHTAEVVEFDDETYSSYSGPLPKCKKPAS